MGMICHHQIDNMSSMLCKMLFPIYTNLFKYVVPHSMMQKEIQICKVRLRLFMHVIWLGCFLACYILVLWEPLESLLCFRGLEFSMWGITKQKTGFLLHFQESNTRGCMWKVCIHVENIRTKMTVNSMDYPFVSSMSGMKHNNRMKDDIYSNSNSWRVHTHLYKHT